MSTTISERPSAPHRAPPSECDCRSLPFETPLLSTYLYFAFVLGTSPSPENLIVNNFVQLSAPFLQGRHLPLGFVPMFGTDACVRDPTLPSPGFSQISTAAPTDAASLTEQIAGFISSGRYVHILLDEYYIPERTSYRRRHFVHDNLVISACPRCQSCVLAGYTQRGGGGARVTESFGISKCRSEEVAAAYASALSMPSDRIAHRSIAAFLPESNPPALDAAWIKAQLQEYLRGEHTPSLYLDHDRRFKGWMVDPTPAARQGPVRYGLDVYDAMREILHERANNGDPSFLSAFRIFWEHKVAAALRARLLVGKESDLARRFESIQAAANTIRLKAIFHRIQRRAGAISEMAACLEQLRRDETDAVRDLISCI